MFTLPHQSPRDLPFTADHTALLLVDMQRAWLDPLLEAVAKEIGLLVKGDFNGFMSRVAHLTQPAKEGKK